MINPLPLKQSTATFKINLPFLSSIYPKHAFNSSPNFTTLNPVPFRQNSFFKKYTHIPTTFQPVLKSHELLFIRYTHIYTYISWTAQVTTWIVIKVSIIQKKTYTHTHREDTQKTHRERGTNHRRGRVGGGGGGGRKGSVSRGISNAVINRKSKRVKRAGREIKSDGRTACIVHGCISAP